MSMRTHLTRVVLVLGVAWGAAAHVLLAGCGLKSDRHFVRIAEGLTSPTLAEGIRVAPRMFSAPMLVDVCKSSTAVDRLKASPGTLELSRGSRYSLSSLTVVAVNGADIAVPGLPIVLEVEDREPPVLQLRSDDPDLNQGRVLAIGTGSFRMRVRTMCGDPFTETVIEGRVVQ
jgi:hypothetical protein